MLARKLSTSVPTVLLWRKRFESDDIAGILEDRPRSGRPKRISAEREAALVEATMKTTPKDATHLSIDNNHTERSLRGIAVGRRNWTFLGSDRGGRTMAVLRSFVGSCELVRVDPFAWFQDVLARIGDCSIHQLDDLLPHRAGWRPGHS